MNVGCALASNFPALIVFRFLVGEGAAGCVVIAGGILADLFRLQERARAVSLYSIFPLLGPVVGPVCGGFLAKRAGWRWVRLKLDDAPLCMVLMRISQAYWLLAMLSGFLGAIMLVYNKETNPQILLKRKSLKYRHELNRDNLVSYFDEKRHPKRSETQYLNSSLVQPLKAFQIKTVDTFRN
jgi:MFS family permease